MFCNKCGKLSSDDNADVCEHCGYSANNSASRMHSQPFQIEDMSVWGGFCSYWKNYATFTGRARRTEYWGAFLFNFILSCAIGWIPTVGWILTLASIIPGWAIMSRRFHDIGKSLWNWLWLFIPIVGAIMVLIWFCKDGDAFENQYGPDPKGRV
jgi:uncharacterized membrane protein YhaH (DUF805 family)